MLNVLQATKADLKAKEGKLATIERQRAQYEAIGKSRQHVRVLWICLIRFEYTLCLKDFIVQGLVLFLSYFCTSFRYRGAMRRGVIGNLHPKINNKSNVTL